jgi:ribosomal subunit interface protein
MQTTITVRHSDIPDPLRERAISVMEHLGSLAPRSMEAAVVFDTDGTQSTVELRLHLPQGEILVAKGDAADHRTALDRAEQKLRRQVERAADRPRRGRSPQPNNPL